MSQGRSGVTGSLASWNDERGFGFIQPNEGGERVFVHISAFSGLQGRPATGDAVRFSVVAGDAGRPRAEGVQRLGPGASGPSRDSTPRGRLRPLAFLPVALLVGYLWLAVAMWLVPLWVPVLYLGMSLVTFTLYAVDKRRARVDEWRIPEATLQLAGLACGWPGGVLAQQLLRHKNRKRPFQVLFWTLAVVNSVVLALLVHQTSLLR